MLLQAIANAVANALGYSDCIFAGSGAFKETYRVTDAQGAYLALKLIDRRKISAERTRREIDALTRCASPNIAKVHQVTTHSEGGLDYDIVVEEFLDGGNLEDKMAIASLTVPEVLNLAVGIVTSLAVLNNYKLVHRDIKPANIMFRAASQDPILTDFGIVRDLSAPSLTKDWASMGPCTPLYAAPEQLRNQKNLIDWRADQFSTGVLMSYALYGVHPYFETGMDDSDVIDAVGARKISKEFLARAATDNNAALILKMVDPWPVKRFTNPKDLLDEIQKL